MDRWRGHCAWALFHEPVEWGCYWERLSGTTGSSSDVLANEFISFDSGQEIVDIAIADYAFKPDHECGTWSQQQLSPPSGIPPGRWFVGSQIAAGQYETNASSGCCWERLRASAETRATPLRTILLRVAGGRSSRSCRQMKGFTAMMTAGRGFGVSGLRWRPPPQQQIPTQSNSIVRCTGRRTVCANAFGTF